MISSEKEAKLQEKVLEELKGLSNDDKICVLAPIIAKLCFDDYKEDGNDNTYVNFMNAFTSIYVGGKEADLRGCEVTL